MKFQFVLAITVVLFSLAARAEFRRLTFLNCTDEAGTVAVEMKFDSSISPYGPQVLKIYGDEATHIQMILADNTVYSGMANGLPFEFTAQNKNKYESKLMIDNSQRKVSCEYKTKFRL